MASHVKATGTLSLLLLIGVKKLAFPDVQRLQYAEI